MGTVRSICILALLSSLPLSASTADQTSASNSSTLPVLAQPLISASVGQNDPCYQVRLVEGGFRLENAHHNLVADFTKKGVSVRSGTGLWTIALRGYGYSGTLKPLSLSQPHARLNRVEYQYGSLTEWYVNGPVGLEQGFTIMQAPEKRKGQPLTIELTLSGDGSSLDKGGEGLLLSGHDGETLLRYRGFSARDARGRPLRMGEKLKGNRLLLTIEDSSAKYPIIVDPWVQLAKLTSSDPVAYNFGLAIAISGNTVVVGAPYATVGTNRYQGAAYVFVKPPSGWTNMTQTAMLTASNGGSSDTFGLSVAINKNTIVVGAPGHGIGTGAAYVFVKPESGWGDMTQTAFLRDSGVAESLGLSVAVSGDTVVVTSDFTQNHGEGPGVAYVYVKPPGGWTDANQTATLNPSDGKQENFFGYSSSISGDTVVVGSPSDLTSGAAYVFVKPKTGWPQTMAETAKLTASDGKGNDFFGFSVTTDATTVVAGAPYAPWKNNFGPGAAYVFVKPPSGWKNTTERAKLTASGGKSGDYFGNSLSLSGDLLAVGAPLATVGAHQRQGLTYLFHKPKDGWKTTSQFAAKVTSADGAANDNFGFSISLSGATVVAGAPYASTNAGYVFQFHSTN